MKPETRLLRTSKKLSQQKGQALPIVLILLLFGGLFIVPMLVYSATVLKAGQVIENKTLELYAADSGIEHGIWRIMRDLDIQKMPYEVPVGYELNEKINNKVVSVSIERVWLLRGLESDKGGTIPHKDWVILTRTPYPGKREVVVSFIGKGSKRLERVGVWMPHGFRYQPGTSSGMSKNDPEISSHYGGGSVLTWDWKEGKGPEFKTTEEKPKDTKIQAFEFTPTKVPKGFAWVRFQSRDIFLCWESGVEFLLITSRAGGTQVMSGILYQGADIDILTWEFGR